MWWAINVWNRVDEVKLSKVPCFSRLFAPACCCWREVSHVKLGDVLRTLYYQWQKYYCSPSYVSNLTWKREDIRGKKIRSIDSENTYRNRFVLVCCMYFHSKVMRVWKSGRERYPSPIVPHSAVGLRMLTINDRIVGVESYSLKFDIFFLISLHEWNQVAIVSCFHSCLRTMKTWWGMPKHSSRGEAIVGNAYLLFWVGAQVGGNEASPPPRIPIGVPLQVADTPSRRHSRSRSDNAATISVGEGGTNRNGRSSILETMWHGWQGHGSQEKCCEILEKKLGQNWNAAEKIEFRHEIKKIYHAWKKLAKKKWKVGQGK